MNGAVVIQIATLLVAVLSLLPIHQGEDLRGAGSVAPTSDTLRCEPDTVSSSDTLVLHKVEGVGSQLIVENPERTHFVLVLSPHVAKRFSSGDADSRFLMPSRTLKEARTVRIDVGGLTGIPFVVGRETSNESVFQAEGRYKVLLGKNLFTEMPVPSYSCTVVFSG